MPTVVVTAAVEDPNVWEERFRTHGDLIKSYSVNKPVRFAVGDGRVAVCFEADDLDTCMKGLQSDATAEAMAHDGVKRETVQMYVLDKSLEV